MSGIEKHGEFTSLIEYKMPLYQKVTSSLHLVTYDAMMKDFEYNKCRINCNLRG